MKPRREARELLIDVGRNGNGLNRIHCAKRQHNLESMHFQLGRLKAVAKAPDINDAILHTFKSIKYFYDGATVTLDKINLVACFRFDGLF